MSSGAFERHTVEVDGRSVDYRALGSGEPVVLVHGLSGSWRWWETTARALADRFRVLLPDLPGHGGRPAFRAPAFAGAPEWLAAWLAGVGVRETHLVGHSLGGFVCARLAARRPELVRRLVLVSPAGVPERSLLGSVGPLVGSVASMSPAFLRRLVADAARAGPVTLLRAARDLLDDDLRDELPRVRATTLVVWGGRDALVPVRHARIFRSLIPDARLLVLRDAWHVPQVEQPEPFSRAVAEFLGGGEPADARGPQPSRPDATSASRAPRRGS
jgi:pimeloyl-ACP methyl ester carboxylesterase